MDISIIIVSWNVAALLEKCLASIFRYSQGISFEVFVVDNASTDGSPEMVKKKFPQVKLIGNQDNLGFACANNQAIRRVQGKYILLLNPDAELINNFLQDILAFAVANPQAAIIGPKILFADQDLQPSVRRLPSLADQLLILLKIHNFFPNLGPLKYYYLTDFDYSKPAQVEQVMGAAMLIRREIFQKIGLLDEKFWLLFEEVDFCARVLAAGFKIYYTPVAQLIHHKAQSFARHKTLAKQINFNHNLFLYFKKHQPFYQLLCLWMIQPFSLILALIDQIFGLKKIIGKNPAL